MKRGDLEFRILELIEPGSPLDTDDIAGQLGVDPAALEPVVHRMEADGWIEHVAAPSERGEPPVIRYWRLYDAGAEQLRIARGDASATG